MHEYSLFDLSHMTPKSLWLTICATLFIVIFCKVSVVSFLRLVRSLLSVLSCRFLLLLFYSWAKFWDVWFLNRNTVLPQKVFQLEVSYLV